MKRPNKFNDLADKYIVEGDTQQVDEIVQAVIPALAAAGRAGVTAARAAAPVIGRAARATGKGLVQAGRSVAKTAQRAAPAIGRAARSAGKTVNQGLTNISKAMQPVGGSKKDDSFGKPKDEELDDWGYPIEPEGEEGLVPGTEPVIPGNTEPVTEPGKPIDPTDQLQINKAAKTSNDPNVNQQVTTTKPVKKIPKNIQKQMVDGAINGILAGGVEPDMIKRQIKQAIQQIK